MLKTNMTSKEKHNQAIIEYNDCSEDVKKLKRKIPYYIGVVLILPFFHPYIPGRRGRPALIERMEYHEAVIFGFVVMTITLSIFYFWKMDNLKKRLRELKLKKHLTENELNTTTEFSTVSEKQAPQRN